MSALCAQNEKMRLRAPNRAKRRNGLAHPNYARQRLNNDKHLQALETFNILSRI